MTDNMEKEYWAAFQYIRCKNNNGALGKPSAWRRRNGLFEEVPDFDWPAFYGESDAAKNEKTTEALLAQVFDNRTEHL